MSNSIHLFGYPIAHSLSPAIMNESFRLLGLDYNYSIYEVKPPRLSEAVEMIRKEGIRGVNLTMPLKEDVLEYLDELSEVSTLCKSVNTIVNQDGRLTGHSTDGIGFINALKDDGFDISGKKIVLLGGGGAAKSILASLALSNCDSVLIFKRKNDTFSTLGDYALKLSQRGKKKIELCDIADAELLKSSIQSCNLLINTTNVGMKDDKSSLIPKSYLHEGLFVSDIIYNPLETTLLKDAKSVGAKYSNGIKMLLFQAAESFNLWTGKTMPVEEVRKVLPI